MSQVERAVPYGEGRAAVIEATVRLVAREGIAKLSFRALAAEARVSTGAVRHSFPTIDDVLEAALDDCIQRNIQALRVATNLSSYFDIMHESISADPERSAFEVKVMIETQVRPALQEVAERSYLRFAEFTKSFLEDKGLRSDDVVVEALMAFADGMNYQRVVFGGADSRRLVKQLVGLQLMTDGLALSESPPPRP